MADDLKEQFLSAANGGDHEGMARLFALGPNPLCYAEALRNAAKNGHAECVKLLIHVLKNTNSDALCLAAMNGHVECVKLLIYAADPESYNPLALRWAAMNGHSECVKLLISDSTAGNSNALCRSVRNGHVDSFKLLLPASEPLIEIDGLLSEVLRFGQAGILSIMLVHEPRFLARMNLAESLAAATAAGHLDLQSLLTSIIEKQGLDAHLSTSRAATSKSSRL